jgi:hypothetical protein
MRLRWIGAILLLLVVAVGAFLTVRFYGLRAGWWPTLLPAQEVSASLHALYDRILSQLNR